MSHCPQCRHLMSRHQRRADRSFIDDAEPYWACAAQCLCCCWAIAAACSAWASRHAASLSSADGYQAENQRGRSKSTGRQDRPSRPTGAPVPPAARQTVPVRRDRCHQPSGSRRGSRCRPAPAGFGAARSSRSSTAGSPRPDPERPRRRGAACQSPAVVDHEARSSRRFRRDSFTAGAIFAHTCAPRRRAPGRCRRCFRGSHPASQPRPR